ncbi:MAG: methylenetetrahydrofolate--tRNA-(uracil(54)-C(5))-methyltransferase (FADH(2)-oxidizing) TrmFO [Oscillospiraceae bacterium]|nr:methylenetetrahydrofolate--tRNA-(uracil(54)-C(5))-methyltransferase (FADH(2)-oxidizing) TrmFO [Oscillospiraceae bacterium]
MQEVKIIGAGLAGCEAAWQLAQSGIKVKLYEMKPLKYTPAHKYHGFAELVCSNSLKAERVNSAAGLLKEEMRRLGSLIVECALQTRVSAGGALAVDRELFSNLVTEKIKAHANIETITEEITEIPSGKVIIATGPLTAGGLAQSIEKLCGGYLSFYDAASPIVTYDSIDSEKVFFAARYGKGEPDYINCPFTKEEYELFYHELTTAQSAPLNTFDNPHYYEGCMPVEVLAKRGADAIRYGCMKPVGLTNPKTGERPYAVVQLRKENGAGTLYNIVGFQTNLKFGEQKRVFSLIPGLENAEFVRYGVMHRNSFIHSPKLLNADFSLKNNPNLFFAGQITGVEGYMESAASGILAGINMQLTINNEQLTIKPFVLPPETMLGALARYISDESVTNFQPMGANMGILPELQNRIKNKQEKYTALANRSLEVLRGFLEKGDCV